MNDFIKLNGYNVADAQARKFIDSNLKVAFLSNADNDLGMCNVAYNDEHVIIFDLGFENNCASLRAFLSTNTNKKIDAIVISHYHWDHVGNANAQGLSVLLSDSNLDLSDCVFYLPHHEMDYSRLTLADTDYQQIEQTVLNMIVNSGCTYVYPIENQQVSIGDVVLQFNNLNASYFEDYYDYLEGNYTQLNNFSMITTIHHGKNVIAMTGDIQVQAEKNNIDIMKNVNLFQIPHHNINNMANEQFANNLNPKFAVFNCRENIGLSVYSTFINRFNQCGCIVTDTWTSDTPIFISNQNEVIASSEIIPSPFYTKEVANLLVSSINNILYDVSVDDVIEDSISIITPTTLDSPFTSETSYGILFTFGQYRPADNVKWLWQYAISTWNNKLYKRYNNGSNWQDWVLINEKSVGYVLGNANNVANPSSTTACAFVVRGEMCHVFINDLRLVAKSHSAASSETELFSGLPKSHRQTDFILTNLNTFSNLRVRITTNGEMRVHYGAVENASHQYYGYFAYPIYIP